MTDERHLGYRLHICIRFGSLPSRLSNLGAMDLLEFDRFKDGDRSMSTNTPRSIHGTSRDVATPGADLIVGHMNNQLSALCKCAICSHKFMNLRIHECAYIHEFATTDPTIHAAIRKPFERDSDSDSDTDSESEWGPAGDERYLKWPRGMATQTFEEKLQAGCKLLSKRIHSVPSILLTNLWLCHK